MSFAQVVDTRATRPFPSSPPTNIGKEKGRRRQTSENTHMQTHTRTCKHTHTHTHTHMQTHWSKLVANLTFSHMVFFRPDDTHEM